MKQLNIKDFFNQRKAQLKNFAQATGVENKIKLGIIDATAEDDAANKIYIKRKVDDFIDRGWDVEVYKTNDPMAAVVEANRSCSGIIIQEPVAPGTQPYTADIIPKLKDVDGFRLDSDYDPATPAGIITYLNACGFEYEGKNAVVIGRSHIVGRPMAKMLTDRDMNVTILHSKTKEEDKAYFLAVADLVVVAVGKPGVLTREECPHAIVVDVGINRVDGKLCGDFVENEKYVTEDVWSTPVPGGVGLLTRLALMENTLEATFCQNIDLSVGENL